MVIRPGEKGDLTQVLSIINDAALAYRGVIPDDRWHDPYMPREQLEREIAQGVEFRVAEEGRRVLGVMGIQDRSDVALIRHAYVESATQRKGVGGVLLRQVEQLTTKPMMEDVSTAALHAVAAQVMCRSLPNAVRPSLRATARDAAFCHDVL